MDKKQDKQHQNLSLHERYLALLDKHNAENADKPPEEQEGPQIKNEVVKRPSPRCTARASSIVWRS